MNCGRCGERPGRIRYTEVVAGEKRRLMICAECAEELGFGIEEVADAVADPEEPAEPGAPEPSASSGAVVFGGAGVPADAALLRLRCPGCGIRGAELRNASLLGCPQCYDTFGRWLEPVLERLHGASQHRGRRPGGASPPDAPEGTA